EALAFYTQRLGFEVRQDVPMGPEMRWLTVAAPGATHELLLAAVDHHIAPADRTSMREIVAKGDLAVFIQVDDLDKTFESLRGAPETPCTAAPAAGAPPARARAATPRGRSRPLAARG